MTRPAPQRRLLGEEGDLRIARAHASTHASGFAETIEALFLVGAGVATLSVENEATETLVRVLAPEAIVTSRSGRPDDEAVPRTHHAMSPEEIGPKIGVLFCSESARSFAEGAASALRTLREVLDDDA